MKPDQGKTKGPRGSFRSYVIAAFALIAAATSILVMVMVAFIFNIYFTSYTSENIESLTEFVAARVSEEYGYTHSLNIINYDLVLQNLQAYDEAGIMVLNENGDVVYVSADIGEGGILADSVEAPEQIEVNIPTEASQMSIEDITYNGQVVGSVRIWIYGSDVLMRSLDIAFRNNTYKAILLAGLVAIMISLLIGWLFSRRLVAPIKKITYAANKLSEGDLSVRTGLTGGNEISQLGAQFDKMAESLENDKQLEMRLTSDVAHELRTPLMAITANIEAMMDGVYPTDTEHLALVDSEARRLSRLVDALLKLTRLERRSQPLNEEITDLGELAENIVSSHELFVEDSGLTIEAHVDGTVKAVCDKDLIRQAIANLISNAVRYTDEGGSIDVYAYNEDKWAVIAVKDTGIGLTPEEEKMVFSRFWRSDASRAKESGGLGVGLAVVKEIVSRHGGEISAKGEKGVGSTFTIKLPRYNEEASQRQARAALKAFEKRNK